MADMLKLGTPKSGNIVQYLGMLRLVQFPILWKEFQVVHLLIENNLGLSLRIVCLNKKELL